MSEHRQTTADVCGEVGEGSASDEPTARTSDPLGSEFVSEHRGTAADGSGKVGAGSASDEPTARTSDPEGSEFVLK